MGYSLVNPRRKHRRHHRNPRHHGGRGMGMLTMVQHPGESVMKGVVGAVGAFLPVAGANYLLPFPGNDIMSKALRFASRAAAAGLMVSFGSRFVGHNADALKIGAYIGVAGGTVLDLLGTRVVVGYGDVTQTPGQLIAGFGNIGSLFTTAPATGTVAGLGSAYAKGRPGALGAAYVAGRPGRLAGIHGGGTRSMGPRHGLFGGM